jgi:hypothetical protein
VLFGVALGGLAVVALAAPLEFGVRAHLAPSGHYFPQLSLQYALATILPLPAAAALIYAICGAIAIAGLRSLLLGRPGGAIGIALAAWFALPNPYPWYALWILPAAFLAPSGASAKTWAVIAASLLIVFRYYGDATTDLSRSLSVLIVALQYAVPIALFMGVRTYRARRDRPEIHTPVPDFAPTRNL